MTQRVRGSGVPGASWEGAGGSRTPWSAWGVTITKVQHEVKKDHGKHKGWCNKHKKCEDD